MGVVWRNRDLNHLESTIRALPDDILKAGEEIITEASRDGARQMRENISTRGTERSGKRGRIETGTMLENVTNTAERVDSHRVQARWGWLRRRENYFRWQEQGFRNPWTQQDVVPMHALLDSFLRVREDVLYKIARMVRR